MEVCTAVAQVLLSQPPDCLVLQTGYAMNRGMAQALADGHQWLLHLDADEIMYPTLGPFSLAAGSHARQALSWLDHV